MNRTWISVVLAVALVALAFGALPAPGASAAGTVVTWGFDASNTTPNSGSGTISRGSGLVAATTEYPQGNPTSGQAWSSRDFTIAASLVSTDYIDILVDLTNHAGTTLSFDDRASATGPKNYEIYYSIDGATFTTTGAVGAIATTFGTHTHSFAVGGSVDQAIQGQSTVYFRIYAWGATGASGTYSLDNVSVSASDIPTAVTLRTLDARAPHIPLAAAPVFGLMLAGGVLARRRLIVAASNRAG